jgi:hypothetical protein
MQSVYPNRFGFVKQWDERRRIKAPFPGGMKGKERRAGRQGFIAL